MTEKQPDYKSGKKTIEKVLFCIACKKEVNHKVKIIPFGTPSFPIFEYRTICSNCGALRRLPKEPK